MSYPSKTLVLCAFVALAGAAIDNRRPAACHDRPVIGICRAALPSYYYNTDTGTCDCFLFGGCNAGRNNFPSAEACVHTCGVAASHQATATDCRGSSGASSPASVGAGDLSPSQVNQLEQIFTETANQHISSLDNTPQHKLPVPPRPTPAPTTRRPPPANLFPLVTVDEATTAAPVVTTRSPAPTTRKPARTTRRPATTTRRPARTTRRPTTTTRPATTARRPQFPPAVPGVTARRPISELRSDFQDRIINSHKQKLQDIIRRQRQRELAAQMRQQEQLRDQIRQQQRIVDSREG